MSGGIIFLKEDWGLSSFEEEMVVSITVLSAALGCVLSAHPAAVWGRLPVLIFAAAAYTVGALLVAAAGNLAVLLTSRFILGIGVGVASYLCPIDIAEIAPKERRASLVTINNVLIVLGQVRRCDSGGGGGGGGVVVSGVVVSGVVVSGVVVGVVVGGGPRPSHLTATTPPPHHPPTLRPS